MNLPAINVFETSYESWETRLPTQQEMMQHLNETGQMLHSVNVRLRDRVDNHIDAARYMLMRGADNGLESFIEQNLDKSSAYKLLRDSMPSKTPNSISDYQKKYQSCDLLEVAKDIDSIGITLTEGTFLFHGGFWPNNTNNLITDRPLSTTFCPQVALRSAEWCGKAYNVGEIQLFVLKVVNPKTKVFAFRRKGTNLGHEKEVLFSSGAILTLCKKTLIQNDYNVAIAGNGGRILTKKVPAYLLEINIA